MSIREMQEISKAKGSFWFSPSSMAFFGTIIETEPDTNDNFITSEQDNMGVSWNGERRYTIRHFDRETGNCDDVSEFGEYKTLKEAMLNI